MRIAIVNDLMLARTVLRRVVESVPGYEVAWEAENGAVAVEKARRDRPDVILMDLLMPVMDGAEATRQIMQFSPCPILVVTASVRTNHRKVYEALGAGGLDAVRTPSVGPGGQLVDAEPLLQRLEKLVRLSGQAPERSNATVTVEVSPSSDRHQRDDTPLLIALGASTGGPEALSRVLKGIGSGVPAIIVAVQHIGADYCVGLAEWLSEQVGFTVRIPRDGHRLEIGDVLLAGGDQHLIVDGDGCCRYQWEPRENYYFPSVDVFFQSLSANWLTPGIAVLLSGMGSDGARGLLKLRQGGWHTIAQDEATSVVDGMPRAAREIQAAVEVLPVDAIGMACRSRIVKLSR